MVYHSNNHFKHYSLIEGLQMEKMYVNYGKKLNHIYFYNLKKLNLYRFKKNYENYKNYVYKLYNFNNNKIYKNIDYNLKNNILVKVQKFLKKNNNNNCVYSETNLSNAVTNYFRNKYI
tara:strand:+ start:217 stop:570 length:354 start_codon:yes stop_codon:yes gene_type:complete